VATGPHPPPAQAPDRRGLVGTVASVPHQWEFRATSHAVVPQPVGVGGRGDHKGAGRGGRSGWHAGCNSKGGGQARGQPPTDQERARGKDRGQRGNRPDPHPQPKEDETMADQTTKTTEAQVADQTQHEAGVPDGEGGTMSGPGQSWHTQKDHKGKPERVDAWLHTHRLVCPICGEVRWLAPGDVFQVDACKPCVEQRRKEKRNARARRKRAERRMEKIQAEQRKAA